MHRQRLVPMHKNQKCTGYLQFAERAFNFELINQPSASFANKLKLFSRLLSSRLPAMR